MNAWVSKSNLVSFLSSGGFGGRGGRGGNMGRPSGMGRPGGMGRGGRDGFSSRGGGGGKHNDLGKMLRKPKWNLSELPEFQKNFYREHPNVQNRTIQEIDDYRQGKEITIFGRNVPKPVFTFEEAGFPGIVLCGLKIRVVKSSNYWYCC